MWHGRARRVVHTKFLWSKLKEKGPLGRPRRKCEHNIKMDVQEIGRGNMDWLDLLQDNDIWRTLVKAVMRRRVPYHAGISLLAAQLLASQDGLCSGLYLFCSPLD